MINKKTPVDYLIVKTKNIYDVANNQFKKPSISPKQPEKNYRGYHLDKALATGNNNSKTKLIRRGLIPSTEREKSLMGAIKKFHNINEREIIKKFLYTVSEFTSKVSDALVKNSELKIVYLQGEISNLRSPRISRNGNKYAHFSLKDKDSVVSAITHDRGIIKQIENKDLVDGDEVVILGNIQVSSRYGTYNISVKKLEWNSVGDLMQRLKELDAKLDKEGIFSKKRQPIPKYPLKVGVVTGKDSAAWSDFRKTILRRNSFIEITVFFSLVQGAQAKNDLIEKLKWADQLNFDVILIGRGGGSIEDMWSFNEEELIRFASTIKAPIISAVGHEIDHTLMDRVADMRAETPTGAAERVSTYTDDMFLNFTCNVATHIVEKVNNKLMEAKQNLIRIEKTFFSLSQAIYFREFNTISGHLGLLEQKLLILLQQKAFRFENAANNFNLVMSSFCFAKKEKLIALNYRLQENVAKFIESKEENISWMVNTFKNLTNTFLSKIVTFLERKSNQLDGLNSLICALDYHNTLKRGFALLAQNGTVVDKINKVDSNIPISIKMHDGEIISKILKINKTKT